MKTVVIIGGGASGMMAALSASENPENRIILLERQQRVGKKLLATGNGRCNLTNVGAKPANYHGEQPEFAVPALQKLPPEKVLEFFRRLGLLTVTEYGGRVYPLSNSANSVCLNTVVRKSSSKWFAIYARRAGSCSSASKYFVKSTSFTVEATSATKISYAWLP